MDSRKSISIAWFLLVLVCFLWWLDCTTRPAADPYLVRIGNLLIDCSGDTSGDSFVYRAGRWLVNVGSGNAGNTSSTHINVTTNNTTVTAARNSSALVGKWKLKSIYNANGTPVSFSETLIIDFAEGGIARGANSQNGSTQIETATWFTADGKLYLSQESLFDTESEAYTYHLSGNTLTLTNDDGYRIILVRTN